MFQRNQKSGHPKQPVDWFKPEGDSLLQCLEDKQKNEDTYKFTRQAWSKVAASFISLFEDTPKRGTDGKISLCLTSSSLVKLSREKDEKAVVLIFF